MLAIADDMAFSTPTLLAEGELQTHAHNTVCVMQ